MGAGHTPGPWQAYGSVQKERGYLIDTALLTDSSNGTVIADNVCGHQAEANARLIAAAPELLEALETILRGEFNCSPHQRFMAAQGVAERAIAKATGSRAHDRGDA